LFSRFIASTNLELSVFIFTFAPSNPEGFDDGISTVIISVLEV